MNAFCKKICAALCYVSVLAAIAPSANASLIALYQYDNINNLGLDSSGNGNDLINGAGTVGATTGKYGTGLNLNGGSDLVSSSGTLNGLPTGASSYTISSWFNPSVGGAGGIVGWGNYGAYGEVNALRMNGDNYLHNYWWANDLTSGYAGDLISGSGSDGWHFVAVTYDAGTNYEALYIDGMISSARYADGLNVQGANFAVGKTFASEYFIGQLDNTAIFNQALSLAQLNVIATGNYSAFNVPEPASLALLGMGVLGLIGTRRRAKNRAV